MELGATVMLPEFPTVPMFGLSVTEVAPFTFQVRIEDWPPVITGGLALKLVITGVPEGPGTPVQLNKPCINMSAMIAANFFIQHLQNANERIFLPSRHVTHFFAL
jgi:hypothetical protein